MFATKLKMAAAGALAGFYPHEINQSARFNDNDSAYMLWTPGGVADDAKKWSYSFWIKRCNLGTVQRLLSAGSTANNRVVVGFAANDTLAFYAEYSSVVRGLVSTDMVFRDPTSWYHILITLDAANNQITYYVNGLEVDQTVTTAIHNVNHFINNDAYNQAISRDAYAATNYGDFYLAETRMVDGLELLPTDFGQFKSGIWVPKRYTGSYGSNGYYQPYSNSAHFGEDQSGNGNDFTDFNLATNDQVLDTPTNNWCVLNPLDKDKDSTATWSDGNLKVTTPSLENRSRSTMTIDSNVRTYWEITLTTISNSPFGLGLRTVNSNIETAWTQSFDRIFYTRPGSGDNGDFWDGSSWSASYGTPVQGDVIGFAVYDNKLWVSINNSWVNSGDPAAGTGYVVDNLLDDMTPAWFDEGSAASAVFNFDFGQLGFTYTPPTGFKALNSRNLPTPPIKDSSTGFYAGLRTGTGAEAIISDVNFPVANGALTWIKCRSNASSHRLTDTLRGATNEIYSDSTTAETPQVEGVKSFTSTGYVLGTNTGVNLNTFTYVDWLFRKGQKYGLDIVSYEGTGIAHAINHNLGAVPEMMLVKNRDSGVSWAVYHALSSASPEQYYGILDTSVAFAAHISYWNNTAPTSTQFTVGSTNSSVNGDGHDMVAYLFRSIPGFSKVFSYTGNGNADGPYVDLGFRSRFIFIKGITALDWGIFDTARNEYNPLNARLRPNESAAEDTSATFYHDVTANGIKFRGTSIGFNQNGVLYVGIAIAEQPGKYSNAR